MKITPIEIRKKTFEKAFRGYEKEEVDAFLKTMSQEWEKVLEENKELKRSLHMSENEVKRLREVENSLFTALKTAENTGANVIEQANKAAELHIREAQILAEGVLNEARQRARNIIEEAEENAREVMVETQDDIKKALREYRAIEDQAETFVQAIQALAHETLDRVDRFRGKSRLGELERKLKDIKTLSLEKKNSEQEFIKVQMPKIQALDLPRPEIVVVKEELVQERTEAIESEVAPMSENERETLIPHMEVENSQQESQAEDTGGREPETEEKKESGSFFDTI